MSKAKRIIKNTRVIILLIAIVLAIFAIHPVFDRQGVAIRAVERNSSAGLANFASPSPTAPPMSREVILSIDNQPVTSLEDYYILVEDFFPNQSVQVKTNHGLYKLITQPEIEIIYLNETENKTIEVVTQMNRTINGTLQTINVTTNETIEVQKIERNIIGVKDIGLSVYDAPTTNIRKGLDLQGGTRVLLQPERPVSTDDMDLIISNLNERLNIFGLSDIIIREAKDLSGNQYISVEVAGVEEKEVIQLIGSQGKFEAKISNKTVFSGGDDIPYVCRSADCSGIDPSVGCGQVGQNEWTCRFSFSISLSAEAAQRQADATSLLEVIVDDQGEYLSEQIDLVLDDQLVDSLNIGADLKGRATTEIAISGSGTGATKQEATTNTLANMKRLQTILITGSLPVKLTVVKTDKVSATLGKEFVRNALLMGIAAILAVTVVVFIRYQSFQIALPMLFTMGSEVVLLLGMASIIGWNLDLAAIAGIIVAVGTGVDDQIVITDETLEGEGKSLSWKHKLKRAFFIIMAAYFTTVVAMIPLLFAGAGLLKGFALTTIIGVSLGVFVTRPAFAAVTEILLN